MEVKRLWVLPELASGRGTARQRRVVEGQSCSSRSNDRIENRPDVTKNFRRRYPEGLYSGGSHPPVASRVSAGSVAAIMDLAVNFDRQTGIAAEKVQDVGAAGMLAAKLQAVRPLSQRLPEHDLGKGHFATQPACRADASLSSFRCDVLKHFCPSTMLRMVPLPEPSSGRIRNTLC